MIKYGQMGNAEVWRIVAKDFKFQLISFGGGAEICHLMIIFINMPDEISWYKLLLH